VRLSRLMCGKPSAFREPSINFVIAVRLSLAATT
jgi:hypothetical protein